MNFMVVSDYDDNIRDRKCFSTKSDSNWRLNMLEWINTPDTIIIPLQDDVDVSPHFYEGISQNMARHAPLLPNPKLIH